MEDSSSTFLIFILSVKVYSNVDGDDVDRILMVGTPQEGVSHAGIDIYGKVEHVVKDGTISDVVSGHGPESLSPVDSKDSF